MNARVCSLRKTRKRNETNKIKKKKKQLSSVDFDRPCTILFETDKAEHV